MKSIFCALWEIFYVQEAGNDGTFCAGGIVLLAGERVGHLFSAFERELEPSKISVSDCDGEGVATGTGDSSAIVAYQATRRVKANILFLSTECKKVMNECFFFFFFFSVPMKFSKK